jgi:hypothetical protein
MKDVSFEFVAMAFSIITSSRGRRVVEAGVSGDGRDSQPYGLG